MKITLNIPDKAVKSIETAFNMKIDAVLNDKLIRPILDAAKDEIKKKNDVESVSKTNTEVNLLQQAITIELK